MKGEFKTIKSKLHLAIALRTDDTKCLQHPMDGIPVEHPALPPDLPTTIQQMPRL